MTVVTSIVDWIFTGSIFGPAILALLAFGLSAAIGLRISHFPNPGVIAALVFFGALAILPSLPRYRFEKETRLQIADKPWIRVINETRWGAIIEPLTWFNAPIGSFYFVMPNDFKTDGFQEVSVRYEEEPHIYHVSPNCENRTIRRAAPDNDGYFRQMTEHPEVMTKEDFSTYCEYDWKAEKAALASAIQDARNSK